MGLRGKLKIRQYTDFDVDGKMFRAMRITFHTDKTEGEFTLDIRVEDYPTEVARELAETRAEEIDLIVG